VHWQGRQTILIAIYIFKGYFIDILNIQKTNNTFIMLYLNNLIVGTYTNVYDPVAWKPNLPNRQQCLKFKSTDYTRDKRLFAGRLLS